MIKLEPLKFGTIGCSRIAKRSVIPAILKSEFAELEIIGSSSDGKVKEFSKEFNCEKFGSYEDVILDDSVDAVYISTPIGMHAELSNKATAAGKHVYVEKSSTYSLGNAVEMVESAKRNNVRLMEGFMFRFHPQHQKVQELINKNKIGELVAFNGSFGFPAFPEGDIRYNDLRGGGFLNDSGCYPICASRMIFDEEPISVGCTLRYNQADNPVDVNGTSILIYGNNKNASIVFGNGNYYQAKYEVWGTDGVISADRAYSLPPDFSTKINLQYNTENNWKGRRNDTFQIQPKDHFLEILDTFCMEITGTKNASYNFEEELLKQAKVMEAHRHSSNTGKQVFLSEL